MYMIETKILQNIWKFCCCPASESSCTKRHHLWIPGTQRSRKVHNHENVSGSCPATAGAFTIAGMEYPKDRMEILRRTGSLIEEPAFYGNLSGRENLDIIRKILDLPKDSVEDALSLTGLSMQPTALPGNIL